MTESTPRLCYNEAVPRGDYMTVYIDVVLLVNFLFNAEILLLLYRLQYEKIRPLRIVTSALLGGGLSLVVFIPYLQPNLSAAARYLTPFFMS